LSLGARSSTRRVVAIGLDPQVEREVPVLVLRPLGGVARVRHLRRDADGAWRIWRHSWQPL
jgi:hypothetical protein